jgi:uncharacterized PurR-regulated membrane protein YhhQ (DUF165 family)
MSRGTGWIALALFVGTIPFANWLLDRYGVVDFLGLAMPAAVFAIGAALIFRDVAHRALGRWWVLAGIALGAVLSLLIAPAFALASAGAFTAGELADLAVYEPLEERGWTVAMVCSNIVGAAVDSWLFLTLAFGSLTFFWGQMVGKLSMTVLAVALLGVSRAVLARHA